MPLTPHYVVDVSSKDDLRTEADVTSELQAVIDNAPDGTTVYFPAGTYGFRALFVGMRDFDVEDGAHSSLDLGSFPSAMDTSRRRGAR